MRRKLTRLLLMSLFFTSCAGTEISTDTSENISAPAEDIVFAKNGMQSPFSLVCNPDASDNERRDMVEITKKVLETTKVMLYTSYSDSDEQSNAEIVINSAHHAECAELIATLSENEYAYKAVIDGDKTKILIAYKGSVARKAAIENFISSYVTEEQASVPANLNVRETVKPTIIESDITKLRDPCVLYDDGIYYVYGTGWVCYKNESGMISGDWTGPYSVVQAPTDCKDNKWAPEVYKYNGAYYMFTTYLSEKTGHRGCTVMRSDSPLGPFVEITPDGHITPHDIDAIDGTLYIDRDGTPYMVFVHEWTCTDDGVGRMAYAELSEDLTHFVSEPVEMFRGTDPSWANSFITDGCWLHRTEAGSLLMIWSNFDGAGYCVGIARSESGELEGPWVQEDQLLFSKNLSEQYDGGHGMIFKHTDGQMYLSIHSPNEPQGERLEMPVFIPLREENDTLVWDK